MADHVGVPPGAALDLLIAKWRERAKDTAKYGVRNALQSHREYFGAVNAAFALAECADELERLRAALDARPPQAPQAWRDIETAPKDGTRVLIVTPGGSVLIAKWSDEANFDRFETKPGWQVFDCEDGFYSWAEESPTHWQPLPHPPAADARRPGQETLK